MASQAGLYETDFYAWTQAQGRAIRAAAAGGNAPVDWENVAEEIETLGRAERRELTSRIGTVIEHLLKLSVSPAEEPRRGWVGTVLRNRQEIADLLEESPSLRPELPAMVGAIVPKTSRLVADLLRNEGELTAQMRARLAGIDLTPEQVLGDWLPERAG